MHCQSCSSADWACVACRWRVHPAAMASWEAMGGLGGLGRGGNNKFERFDDGLQMSESTRRMEGFGSGR